MSIFSKFQMSRCWRHIIHGKIGFVLLLLLGVVNYCVLERVNLTFLQIVNKDDAHNQITEERQPYHIKTGKNHTGTLFIDVQYTPQQNATMIIKPDWGCITHISVWQIHTNLYPESVPAKTEVPLNQTSPCSMVNNTGDISPKIINFGPYLQEGENRITVEMESKFPQEILYFYPQLFGVWNASTLACISLFTIIAIMMFYAVQTMGLSVIPSAITAMAMLYYALRLHFWSDWLYTNDVDGHVEYLTYMANHWMRPYLYVFYGGGEGMHPPLYYLLAGDIFNLFAPSIIISPLTAVRGFSLLLYMIFCIYGLRTLRIAVEKEDIAYFTGCILIVFWPLGAIMATRINNDIAMYAVWSAAFYYVARWFKERDLSCMQIALVLTGIAFMIKSNAVILAGIVGSCILYATWEGWLNLRQLVSKKTLAALGMVFLGIVVNVSRFVYLKICYKWTAVGSLGKVNYNDPPHYDYMHYLSFDVLDFISQPFVSFSFRKIPSFLNYFLKTMLYSEAGWFNYYHLANILNTFVFCWLVIILCGLTIIYIKQRADFRKLTPYLAAILIAPAGCIAFTAVREWIQGQDFRYVVPMIVPLVILFVSSLHAIYNMRFLRLLYWLSILVGIMIPVIGVVFHLSQYLGHFI